MIPALAALPQEGVRSAAQGSLELFGDYSLADPQFLVLLPVVWGLYAFGRSLGGRPKGRSSIVLPVARSLRQRLFWLPAAAHLLALTLAVLALARPLRGNVQSDVVSEGIDIALLIDRSSSMKFDDLEDQRSRLDVVKEVVGEFAERRTTDREGAADHCALISFARYPKLLCPFTLDAGAIQGFLDEVELVRRREEDGTAVGVALAKAVAVLRDSEAESKVVVLLTDGENNVFDITPDQAAELAAEEGIRVYTIYAARYLYEHHPFRGWVPSTQELDTSELQRMAELTGGLFFRASDREELEDIYAEIETLERTEREEQRFEESFDLYLYFLLPSLLLYGLAWFSHSTWARRLP